MVVVVFSGLVVGEIGGALKWHKIVLLPPTCGRAVVGMMR